MQTFSEERPEEKSKNNTATTEAQGIQIIKASKLPIGTHKVRFYPVSPLFREGADDISIVQYFHWMKGKPVICRRCSYDYTVADTEQKNVVDTFCVVCNDMFALYKQAKASGLTESEVKQKKDLGKNLQSQVSAASLVSFIGKDGIIAPPVILRYGKQLLDQIEYTAVEALSECNVHICDPEKGYGFNIVIGENAQGRRNYKQSTAVMQLAPIDITKLNWKWQEVCLALKSEIKLIPSVEEVKAFYIENYSPNGGSTQTFTNPALNNQQSSTVANSNINRPPQENVSKEQQDELHRASGGSQKTHGNDAVISFDPARTLSNRNVDTGGAIEDRTVISVATFKDSEVKVEEVHEIPSTTPVKVRPCHSSNPNGSGYEENGKICLACDQAESCKLPSSVVGPQEVEQAKTEFNTDAINDQLAQLKNKMNP